MNKLYKKSELTFAIVCIVIFCVLQSLANPLSKIIGIQNSAHAIFNVAITIVLFCWIKKNGLMKKYGLCKSTVDAKKFIWYIPLIILSSMNLWNGVAINLPIIETICYITFMLCIGFIEEVLFRGILFKAIAKDSVKQAIVISSVTFGLGHLLHLFDGSGAKLVSNLCQVIGAIAVGFLFVTLFYRSNSLLAAIITHSAIDVISVFANETGLTDAKRIVFSLIKLVITVAYTLIIVKLTNKKQTPAENAVTANAN